MKLSRAFLVVSFLLTSIAEGSAAHAQKRGPAAKGKPAQTPATEAAKQAGAAKSSEEKSPEEKFSEKFSGLELRSIGPALVSGRIVSIAVDPANRAHYYVAAASGARKVRCGGRVATADCSRPPMAGKPGKPFSPSVRTPA